MLSKRAQCAHAVQSLFFPSLEDVLNGQLEEELFAYFNLEFSQKHIRWGPREYILERWIRLLRLGKHVVPVWFIAVILVSTIGVTVLAYDLSTSFNMTLQVKEPITIVDYPSQFSLFPGETANFNVTVMNHASINYSVILDFKMNDSQYQASYVSFSDEVYNVTPGQQNLEASMRVAIDATAATLTVSVDLTRIGNATPAPASLERQISASSDDCQRRYVPDVFVLTDRGETVGSYDATHYKYGTGLRFTNIVIPKGSTITNAYLQFCAHDTLSGTVVNARISAWATDNAPTFTDETDFDNSYGNRTAARVNWDNIGSWQVSSWYMSPDISVVVQEIVNRPKWTSGNSIAFFFEDFDGRSTLGAWRDFSSYDVYPDISATLYINWTAP